MSAIVRTDCPDLVYQYLGHLEVERGYAKQTIYNYFIDLRLFLRFVSCKKSSLTLDHLDSQIISHIDLVWLQHLNKQDVSSFLAWLALEKKSKERTRNRKIAVLKSFFQYLLRNDYIQENIMSHFAMSKSGKSLPKYLDEEAVDELLMAINGMFWIRDYAIIMLMLSSGLRVSEVSALNLQDIRKDSITVLGKGKKERQVYFSNKTKEALQEYLDIRPKCEEEAVFLSKRKTRLAVRSIQEMSEKYFRSIGKTGYSCHKLRHTAATLMLKSGANLREIQETLGHENISTTEIYTHIANGDLKKMAEKLSY